MHKKKDENISRPKGSLNLKLCFMIPKHSLFIFFLMIFIFTFIFILYFFNILDWSKKPDFGWSFIDQMGKIVVIDVDCEVALKSGLRIGDRIISINDIKIHSLSELRRHLSREIPGENVYKVIRKDKVLTIDIPNHPLCIKKAFSLFGLTWILGIVFFLTGALVFFMKPDTSVSWAFLIAMFHAGLFITFSYTSQLSPDWLNNVLIYSSAFLPASVIHLTQIFPVERQWLKNRILSLGIPYIFSLFLFIMMRAQAPLFTDVPKLYKITANIYLAGSLFLFLFSTLFAYVKPISALSRVRSKIILIGLSIAVVLPVSNLIKSLFHSGPFVLNPVSNLPFYAFFPLAIGYTIVRHNLFDVDVYIKRAVGYGIFTAIIMGAYALITVFINIFLNQYQIAQSPAFPILFVIGIILICNPLKNRIQVFVDRIFFRKDYDYEGIIERIGGALTSFINKEQILKQLTETFMKEMFIDTSSIMLLNRTNYEYQVCLAAGEKGREIENVIFKKDEAIIRIIEAKKKELTRYDVLEDRKYRDVSGVCAKNFESLHASLIVPLVFQGELIGLLNFGEKKSGKFYTREDINLMHTLAGQGAVAIENARLFREYIEKQQIEQELSIARDLQMSMLPATCPKIEGFKIAAITIPAKEVGGDFFDFIETGRNKLGIIIGDVSGKSVSGALVVAASRISFRMLSDEKFGIGEIMNKANLHTRRDIKQGIPIALLYAILDTNDHTMRLSSAAQMQPIHVSSKTGEIKFIETIGDNFPLGVLEDVEYKETSFHLNPGDKVILYTDGVVEAMNSNREMFGFDNLLQVIRDSQSIDTDSLLNKIIDSIQKFMNDTPQHDDMTVIVLSVTG